MNIGDFGYLAGSALDGYHRNDDWQQAHELAKQKIAIQKLAFDQAQAEQARQPDVAKGMLALYQNGNGMIPPAPGQASVPMQQPQGLIPPPPVQNGPPQAAPPQAAGRPPITPGIPVGDWQSMSNAYRQQAPQANNERLALLNDELGRATNPPDREALLREIKNSGGANPVPPYRALNQPAPEPQGPTEIPEKPKASFEDAVTMLKSQGINDPQTLLEILDKNQARLDSQARIKIALLKEQEMQQYHRDTSEIRRQQVQNQGRNIDSLIQDRPKRTDLAAKISQLKLLDAGGMPTDVKGVDAMAWDRIISGHNPPARGGAYKAAMSRIEEIAKENGMTSQQLMSASADVKTKLAAKRSFEIRAQNMQRAENNLNSEIPVFESAMKEVNAVNVPALAKAELAVRRQFGDPTVTKMDQAADVVFREFEAIVNGNPGTLNVQDVTNAHDSYMKAQTPKQAQAAIDGMHRIIKNAQGAINKTRNEIMEEINASVNSKPGEATKGVALPSDKASLKAGQIYNTARGPAKWNGTAFEAQ